MSPSRSTQRYRIIRTDAEEQLASFAEAVGSGLTAPVKSIPCRFLYDDAGSALFEEICELPEYYLTRVERGILAERAPEIAAALDGPVTLAELGSGSSAKTRLLIEAFLKAHGRLRYVPVDISPTMLEETAVSLLDRYEGLEVRAIASEYHEGLRHVRSERERPKLIAWLGSSIGNLSREEAGRFLSAVRQTMTPEDRALIGIDLRKSRASLEAAYDDAEGVTARFSLNLLERINRELDADFDLEAFRHEAVYLEDEGRVKICIVSQREQRVALQALGLEVDFAAGEGIHTENAFKYSPQEIDQLAGRAGLAVEQLWRDEQGRYSLSLLAPA